MRLTDLLQIHSGGPPAVDPQTGTMGPGSGNYPREHKLIEDQWKQIGPQQGSNPGGIFQDATGKNYYVKFYNDMNQGKTEILANKIYNQLGVAAPKSKLVKINGKEAVASEIIPNLKPMPMSHPGYKSGWVIEGFVADAWLANHDVVGLEHDNMMVDDNGKVWRTDNGGTLFFRAQGGHKSIFDQNPNSVPEMDSMRDSNIAKQAGPVFSAVTDNDIDFSLKEMWEEFGTPSGNELLKKYVNESFPNSLYGDKVYKHLKGRLEAMAEKYGIGPYEALTKDEAMSKKIEEPKPDLDLARAISKENTKVMGTLAKAGFVYSHTNINDNEIYKSPKYSEIIRIHRVEGSYLSWHLILGSDKHIISGSTNEKLLEALGSIKAIVTKPSDKVDVYKAVSNVATKMGFVEDLQEKSFNPYSSMVQWNHPKKGLKLFINNKSGDWEIHKEGHILTQNYGQDAAKTLGNVFQVLKEKGISVTGYKKKDWESLKLWVKYLNTGGPGYDQAFHTPELKEASLNPAVKKFNDIVDSWKSGSAEGIRKKTLEYINGGHKAKLPEDAKLLIRASHFAPKLDYKLYRAMDLNSEQQLKWANEYAKDPKGVVLAPMGYSSSPTGYGYPESHSTLFILDEGSKAINITNLDSFASEKEHIPSGVFKIKSAKYETLDDVMGWKGANKFVVRLAQIKALTGNSKTGEIGFNKTAFFMQKVHENKETGITAKEVFKHLEEREKQVNVHRHTQREYVYAILQRLVKQGRLSSKDGKYFPLEKTT